MFTGEIAQGTVNMATVFAQQASAAGVTITIRNEEANFYTSQYLHYAFAQDYWYYAAYLPQVSEATLYNSPFNETHFASDANTQETTVAPKNPLPPNGVGQRYIDLYNQAIATQDISLRTELAHELQMIDYTYGGYIIPYFPPVIDGYSKNVGGVVPSLTGLSLGNYSFQQMWKI
jgi:peptide/nickel transport system substrate-binding protein